MGYRVLAYAAAGAHFAFLAFGVFGGFLAWRWPRLIWGQAAGAAWMGLVAVADLGCPLTWVEDRARERAGMAPKPGGFIRNYIEGHFYPAGHQDAAAVVVGLIVLSSWVGFAVLRRRRQGEAVPTRRRHGQAVPRRRRQGEAVPRRRHQLEAVLRRRHQLERARYGTVRRHGT